MKRRGSLRIVVLLLSSLAVLAAKPTAEDLLSRARTLWLKERDLRGALAAYDEAVKTYPNDVQAHLQRGTFLAGLTQIQRPESKEQTRRAAEAEFAWVSDREGDAILGGVARDALRQLRGEAWFPESAVACPAEAQDAQTRAGSLFMRNQYEASITAYREAIEKCPGNAALMTSFGDAVFQLGEYSLASPIFRKALEIEPWRRSTLRFLADSEFRQEHLQAALDASVLAVLADPTYEAGWSQLRVFALKDGRSWNRARSEKTRVESKDGKDGKQEVSIALPAPQGGAGEPDEAAATESAAWLGYGMAKATILGGASDRFGNERAEGASSAPDLPPTRLELERVATEKALVILGEMGRGYPPFWENLRRARQEGLLDAAIYLTMMDRELAAEYPAYREAHSAELIRFVGTVVMPKAPSN
jgi:tetratricopeptide (TPR) repeat protein